MWHPYILLKINWLTKYYLIIINIVNKTFNRATKTTVIKTTVIYYM